MHRVRRTLALVLAVLVGATTLAACRSEPDVAAYVDGQKITVDTVTRWVAEYEEAERQQSRSGAGTAPSTASVFTAEAVAQRGETRKLALYFVIMEGVMSSVLRDRGVEVPTVRPEDVPSALRLAPDSPLAKCGLMLVYARIRALRDALSDAVDPVDPSDDDRREAYRNYVASLQPGTEAAEFDRVAPYLNAQTMGFQVGLRNQLRDEVRGRRVTVNPRFAPLSYPIGIQLGQSASTFISVPLGAQ